MPFMTPSPPKLTEPAPLPTVTDPAIEEARRRNREAAAQRRGRASTIQTSGLGDISDPTLSKPAARNSLLGGG